MAEQTPKSGVKSLSGRIERAICFARGYKVMLDQDLAVLYGVPTKALKRAVKRNVHRFPADFMFELSRREVLSLRCQIGTSSWGGRRHASFAFTEQGVAMLSSVLRSRKAVQVNIEIMRAFVRLRRILAAHRELARRLDELERKYDSNFRLVFEAIRGLMAPPARAKRRIGFRPEQER